MTKVLIVFHSRDGATETLANAIADGARFEGGEIRMRCVVASPSQDYEPPTEADAEWADALIFGSPTRFGMPCPELLGYILSLGDIWSDAKLAGKVGAAFTSTSAPHGGNEATILSLYNPMANLGLIIVPLGYTDPAVMKGGTPYGASSVTCDRDAPPSLDELQAAYSQGRRVAKVAKALTSVRMTETGSAP